MANTGKIATTLAIVLGLWALLIASSMTFGTLALQPPEVQAYKLPATDPVKQTAEERCACVFAGTCGEQTNTAG